MGNGELKATLIRSMPTIDMRAVLMYAVAGSR